RTPAVGRRRRTGAAQPAATTDSTTPAQPAAATPATLTTPDPATTLAIATTTPTPPNPDNGAGPRFLRRHAMPDLLDGLMPDSADGDADADLVQVVVDAPVTAPAAGDDYVI
ncbi:MAG TPA: hypothetical protein PKH77_00485, partial [Anaerolineae bacterium]|nr:hypothetical protein [Anaerolineae bacterium]